MGACFRLKGPMYAGAVAILTLLVGSAVYAQEKINSPAIGGSKDKFRVGPLPLVHLGPVTVRRDGPNGLTVRFGTQQEIPVPLRDSKPFEVPSGEKFDNQGDKITGPVPLLCEAFYALVPQVNPQEKEFKNRDPHSVSFSPEPNVHTTRRFWSPVFVYVVSARQMNGEFVQLYDKWEIEVRDKNDVLRERWEPKKTSGDRLPRFDGTEVYGAANPKKEGQWRIAPGLGAKYKAMMMFDIPFWDELVSDPKVGPAKVFPTGVDVATGDKAIRRVEFLTYARVDTNNDDTADKYIYRIAFGAEWVVKIGAAASTADLKVTAKTGEPTPGSRVEIGASFTSDTPAPVKNAQANDPGKDKGLKTDPGSFEKTAP